MRISQQRINLALCLVVFVCCKIKFSSKFFQIPIKIIRSKRNFLLCFGHFAKKYRVRIFSVNYRPINFIANGSYIFSVLSLKQQVIRLIIIKIFNVPGEIRIYFLGVCDD